MQAEVLRHRVAWPKFWLGWWAQTPGHPANREASPLRRIGWRVGAGWGRHGESGSEADGRVSRRVSAGWETRSESGSDVGGDQSSQSSMDSEVWRQGLEDSVPPAAPPPLSGNHGQMQSESDAQMQSESDAPEWPEWPVQQHPTGSLLHRGFLLQQSRSVTAVNTSNHSEVQLPHPADLIRHLGPSPDPSPSRPCRGCGEHSCDQYPACVRAMWEGYLLGQPPCKFGRAE